MAGYRGRNRVSPSETAVTGDLRNCQAVQVESGPDKHSDQSGTDGTNMVGEGTIELDPPRSDSLQQ